jgi:hypothetical protein
VGLAKASSHCQLQALFLVPIFNVSIFALGLSTTMSNTKASFFRLFLTAIRVLASQLSSAVSNTESACHCPFVASAWHGKLACILDPAVRDAETALLGVLLTSIRVLTPNLGSCSPMSDAKAAFNGKL